MTMAENKDKKVLNVPHLRFPEFSGEWKEYTISEVCDTVTDFVAAGSFAALRENVTYYEEPQYAQLVRTVDLKNDFSNKEQVYVNEHAFDFLWRVNLDKPALILPNIGANIGETYFCTPEKLPSKNNVLGPNAILLRASDELTSFLYFRVSTKQFSVELGKVVGASGQPKFNKTELKAIKLWYPKPAEQRKIAALLSLLDKRITTQNKIIEKLQSLIKGIAQNIVLRNKPNVRISQCLECSSSTLQESDVLEYGTYPVYGANGIVGYLDDYSTPSEAVYIIKDGSGVGAVSYVTGKCSATGTLNALQAKEGFSLQYLYYLLKVFNFEPYKTGMAIPHIYFKDYGKAQIFCPSYSEQLKYAKFLSTIDEKLLAEQNILINISLQKQYLLRQMFI